MNGRLYDPHIARMMQADQIIAGLEDMQFFNRYSYVFNRPTSLVDATGQCPFCLYAIIALVTARATGIIDQQTFRMGLSIVAAVWLGNPQGFLASATSPFVAAATAGFVSGAIGSGTWEGAFQGMAAAMLFYGAGEFAGEGYLDLAKGNSFGRALVHAGAGCINARLSGGSCATGAATAGASKFLSMELPGAETKDVALGTMRAAVIGGTVSVIGGGKFANGAQTAAYQHLFNCVASKCYADKYDDKDPRTHFSPPQSTGTICNTSNTDCLAQVRQELGCYSAPGQRSCTGVSEEHWFSLTGNNPISQYRPSPDMIVNGTTPGHIFDDGYIVRWVAIDSNNDVSIWTAGYGTNGSTGLKWANQLLGPLLFNGIGNSNKQNVQCAMKLTAMCP